MSVTVAAVYLECSRTTLYKIMDAGQLPFEHRGAWRKIRLADLVAFDRSNPGFRKTG